MALTAWEMEIPHSYTRRRFLCSAGVATLAMSPLAHAVQALPSSRPLRLGLVLPPSSRYPRLPAELLSGFESFAATSAERDIALVPIACAAGARAPLVAAADAVKHGAVDVLAGFVDANAAAELAPLLGERGVPFVATDMGADLVRHRCASPMVAHSSLGYWQASHALGRWAAANLGRRVVIVTDFLESGHDLVFAFREAFEAGGGEVLDVAVTGLPDGTDRFTLAASAIREARPDFVCAFFSGHRAERFLRFYDAERLARVAPLAGPGLLADAAVSRDLPASCEGIVSAASWMAEEASPFAMLGRETARRIAGAELADTAPVTFLRRLSRRDGRLVNVTMAQLPADERPQAACRDLRAAPRTGWSQAYLAA